MQVGAATLSAFSKPQLYVLTSVFKSLATAIKPSYRSLHRRLGRGMQGSPTPFVDAAVSRSLPCRNLLIVCRRTPDLRGKWTGGNR